MKTKEKYKLLISLLNENEIDAIIDFKQLQPNLPFLNKSEEISLKNSIMYLFIIIREYNNLAHK